MNHQNTSVQTNKNSTKPVAKIIFTVFVGFLFCMNALAQTNKNSAQVTLGVGSGLSFNYEYIFYKNNKLFVAAGLGVGYAEEFRLNIFGNDAADTKSFTTLAQYTTVNFGKNKRFFEVGLGAMKVNDAQRPFYVYPIIAYRYQPNKKNKLNYRAIACIPFDGFKKESAILFIPFGFSVGYCF